MIVDIVLTSADKVEEIVWSEHDSGKVIVGHYRGGGSPSAKIAAFDYDFTLVCTRSGKAFPVDKNDWRLFHPELSQLINQLVHRLGYRFVVVSNQLGLSKQKIDLNDLKERFGRSIQKIDAPCLILIASQDDTYRKPRIGLWDYFRTTIQPEMAVDLSQSFYVGDAAGRKKSATSKGDHSAGDLLFALNCGLNFMIPERFIASMKSGNFTVQNMSNSLPKSECFKYSQSVDQTQSLLVNVTTGQKVDDVRTILPGKLHCIIFCGLSATGKSSFYRNHLSPLGYVHINQDSLKSLERCMTMAKKSWAESKNCVIDNTNVEKATRARWIELCREHRVTPLILHFDLPLEHVFHNNKFRKLARSDAGGGSVTDMIIYMQRKKWQPPSSDECGDGHLFTVNFVARFANQSDQQLYSLYLNEK